MSYDIHALSHYFITLGNLFRLVMKGRLSNDSFGCIDHIAIKYKACKVEGRK